MSEIKNIVPELDMALIQQKANEAAMKGVFQAIDEYYNKYDSPFVKAIKAKLNEQEFGFAMQLPDVLALFNEAVKTELDSIVNKSIANTYIPVLHQVINRIDKKVNFSEILREFAKSVDSDDREDCDVEINEHSKYDWLTVNLSAGQKKCSLTLHKVSGNGEPNPKYQLLSMPNDKSGMQTMSLKLDNAKLDLPFSRDILTDDFMSFCARMILSSSIITIDTEEFSEDMLDPNHDY